MTLLLRRERFLELLRLLRLHRAEPNIINAKPRRSYLHMTGNDFTKVPKLGDLNAKW